MFDDVLKPIFGPADLRDVMRRYGDDRPDLLVGTFPKYDAERLVRELKLAGYDVFIREEKGPS